MAAKRESTGAAARFRTDAATRSKTSAVTRSKAPSRFDAVTLQILWTRLISIVNEASAALVRTSFSTLVLNRFAASMPSPPAMRLRRHKH